MSVSALTLALRNAQQTWSCLLLALLSVSGPHSLLPLPTLSLISSHTSPLPVLLVTQQQVVLNSITVCSTDHLKMAVHVFQACHLLKELLSVCESQRKGPPAWPWAARLTEPGLQLELAQARPVVVEVVSSLLQQSHHSQACSAAFELLQGSGHVSLAYHTTVQVRVLIFTFTYCPILQLSSTTASGPLLSSLLEEVHTPVNVTSSLGLLVF